MKKKSFIYLFVITMAAFSFFSCEDEKDDGNTEKPNYVFSVAEKDKTITSKAIGEEKMIVITSTKNGSTVGYSVKSHPEWLKATESLTGLTIKFDENTLKEQFTGEIVLEQAETGTLLALKAVLESVEASLNIEESYSTARLKVLSIKPEVSGYDNAPEYKWVQKVDGGTDIILSTEKDLNFIKFETGTYKLEFSVKDGNIGESATTTVSVITEETAYSNYISSVYEYNPAPGWRTGTYPSGGMTDTETTMLEKTKAVLVGNDGNSNLKWINLGGFGGYVVFGFDHTVINIEGKMDFRILSTQTHNGDRKNPGIVMVSFDANGNGEPDDAWYELAGSEYSKTSTRHNIKIAYDKQTSTNNNEYLKWTINDTEVGYYTKNAMGMGTPSYPLWSKDDKITFSGLTLLPDIAEIPTGSMWPSSYKAFDWGYVNNFSNKPEDIQKTSFDISWAVDSEGKKVNLPGVNFVKVYTGVLQDYIGQGQCATEIKAAIDLHLNGDNVDTIK